MNDLFETQREMRQRREAAIKRGVIAVLDVGSYKVSCLVLQFSNEEEPESAADVTMPSMGSFRVVGVGTVRSNGVKFGEITDMGETERAIRSAVAKAQKMALLRVDHVIVCFAGGRPRSYGLSGEVEVEQGEVSERDIGRVLASCEVPPYGQDREAIHALPVNFSLDHRTGLEDPRGQVGARLSVDMHMLTLADAPVYDLLECLKRCDLEVAGLAFSGFASGVSTLMENEQQLGAAIVDLGGGSTAISVFMRKHMIYGDAVRLGGDHITQDICQGLQLSYTDAERIKTLHGGLVATGSDSRLDIEVPNPLAQWENDRRTVSRSDLIGVMRPRVEEILEEVRVRLDAAGFDHLPTQRIVLTGGASAMPGLEELAGRILGGQVRIGRPLRVQGLPHSSAGAGFSAAVGLALHASHPMDECWDFEMPVDRIGTRRIKAAVRWFRQNW
ncbi:MAG: cell division protein FtsA [Rhodobacteraceae bacterium]|nr:cell division protein FtsA [Paracoccaceae bacterium]